MTQIRLLLTVVFAIVLTILSQQVDALKCWGCISTNKRECGEPFVSDKLHKLDYRECSWKCGTLVFNNSEGIKSWYRFCADNQQDLERKCKDQDQISCETCETDGCNTAAEFGPIALFIVIPIAIAKLFLHFVP